MTNLEIRRKLFHLAGLFIPWIYIRYNRQITLLIITPISLGFFLIDISRLNYPKFNRFFLQAVSSLIRKEERTRITSSTWFLLGSLWSVLCYTESAAITSIVILAISDPLASIVGRMFGRTKLVFSAYSGEPCNKTLEGSCAFFLSAMIINYLLSRKMYNHLIILVCDSLIATVIELIPILTDDNFRIPVLLGGYYHLARL